VGLEGQPDEDANANVEGVGVCARKVGARLWLCIWWHCRGAEPEVTGDVLQPGKGDRRGMLGPVGCFPR
jgi:hypothetical protein